MNDLLKNDTYFLNYSRIKYVFALFVKTILGQNDEFNESDAENLLTSVGNDLDYYEKFNSFLNGEFIFNQLAIERLEKYADEDSRLLPKFLYKYRGQNNNFPDNQLFFSDYKTLNDPYECLLYSKLSEKYKFKYYPRLLCLSKKYNSLFMWSFYGDGGQGRCSEYKCEDILAVMKNENKSNLPNIVFFGPRKIKYKNFNPLPQAPNRIVEICSAFESMFVKPQCFKEEKEFRFVALKNIYSSCKTMLDVNPSRNYLTENRIPKKFVVLPIERLK